MPIEPIKPVEYDVNQPVYKQLFIEQTWERVTPDADEKITQYARLKIKEQIVQIIQCKTIACAFSEYDRLLEEASIEIKYKGMTRARCSYSKLDQMIQEIFYGGISLPN